jgi:hypothetical protein
MFPWRVCEVFADARGGSFYDRTAVSCQLYSLGGSVKCLQMPGGSFYDRTVLWRVRKGVRGCQRGGLFAVARQLGAGSLFSIVRQLGASSICLWRARRGICRCRREVRGSQVPALVPLAGREGIRRCQREGQGHDFQSNGSCGVTDVDSSLLEYDILSISSQSLYSISLKAS